MAMAAPQSASVALALALISFLAAFSEAAPRMLKEEPVFHQQAYGNGNTWCMAKPSVEDSKLQGNIDFSCIESGMDCSIIRRGGSCYSPVNLVSHASVAMNLYYKHFNQQPSACYFSGTGIIVQQDPSVGSCIYF